MPKPQPTTETVTSQRDFSAGEIDVATKRDDANPVVKAGVRDAENFRILNTKGMQNRSGRRALFKESNRVEKILMAPGVTYYLAFPAGFFRVYNAAGIQVFSEARPWNAALAQTAVWDVYDKSVYVTIAGMVPRVYTWDGAVTWTAADYAETVTSGNQKRTIFYRISPQGVTMQPASRAVGAGVAVVFSAGMNLTAGHVGTRMQFVGRQILITAVADATHATATIEETLPGSQAMAFATDPRLVFVVGDIVQGVTTGSRGVVTASTGADITVQLLTLNQSGGGRGATVVAFAGLEMIVGPGGSLNNVNVSVIGNPQPVTIWEDEVMNTLRGWPQSCFVDQNRLGFCDFPAVPRGIEWSAVGLPNDLYVGPLPTDAMFELAPNRGGRVLYVAAGMDSSEFVFCDNALYYIPITVTNPLKPGSVQFSKISDDECGQVQPRRAGEFILYVTSGLNQLMAIKIFGSYSRAYKTESVMELSAHLFTSIKAIAIMTASASFAERYIFVLNADGSVATGKYGLDKSGYLEGMIGWTPWSGNGTAAWVSCKGSSILFTTSYAPNGIGAVQIVEQLDDSCYLDGSQLYNTQPSGLPIPGGKGPLWWLAGGAVDLMDGPLGTRMMGTYQIDANGFLVPQNMAGEDFTSVNLIVGQAWTATLEPFIPAAPAGQSIGQRMQKRATPRIEAYVSNSSGFAFQKLYSGQYGPNLPAVGTVMSERRFPAWNVGEDPLQPPPLREKSYQFRPTGRAHDPRRRIIKDTPGPLTIEEISCEVTV